MNTKQRDLLNTQSNAEETHKENSDSNKYEYRPIENTPFKLVCQEGKWFIGFGQSPLTEPCDNKEEALDKLETEKWNIAFHMAIIVCEVSKVVDDYKNKKELIPLDRTDVG